MSAPPNDLIFYHYPFSPYAKRITNYLALRGIDYAQCLQPPVLPRPDLNTLGVQYRRIPLLSINRDMYADTRLILRKLEAKFPSGALSSRDPATKGIERLIERLITDGGVFNRAAALIPAEMPLLKDPKFLADRTQMSGRKWSAEVQKKGRAEALVYMADAFELFETTLLADGRKYLTGGEIGLADVEAQWVFEWLMGMKTLPREWEGRFPKVYAWVKRFTEQVKAKSAGKGKPMTVKGEQAKEMILKAEAGDTGSVDEKDPTGLKKGETVTLFPIDSGFNNKDTGKLVKLTPEEVAIELDSTVVLHAPRWGFRIEKAEASKL